MGRLHLYLELEESQYLRQRTWTPKRMSSESHEEEQTPIDGDEVVSTSR